MDKETLSNYGWIVITLLVLICFIEFSSGFVDDLIFKADKQEQRILLNKTEDDMEDLTLLYEVCETWQCGNNLNAYIMKTPDDEIQNSEVLKYKIYIKPIHIAKGADYSMYDDSSYWMLINSTDNIITPLGSEFGLASNQGIKDCSVTFETLNFSSRITEVKPILNVWKVDDADNPIEHVNDVPDDLTDYKVHTLKINDIVLPASVTKISSNSFACDTIQNSITGSGVTTLKNKALMNNGNMQSAYFDNLSEIGEKALYGNINLNSFYFPNSLTNIGSFAFGSCKSLETVDIISKQINIGNNAFNECESLKSINFSYNIPDSIVTLGDECIRQCTKLQEIYLPLNEFYCPGNFFNLTEWSTGTSLDTGTVLKYYFNGSFQEWINFKNAFKNKNGFDIPDTANVVYI